ncbi:MAG TPA: PPOX class F420-dependent oxidoreductase [Terriglobales bacterium]|nr:PPOX class F420-dependent oxidoreductase [Terriglobales bacterium]
MDSHLAQFTNRKYLNLESYRRSGAAVRTPLWFAEEEGVLFVYSLADSGKVKRIRNDPRVRVVPSDLRGNPKGEWVEARAEILDAAGAARGHQLLRQKYWLKRLGDFFGRLRKRKHAVMAIHVLKGTEPCYCFGGSEALQR